MLVPNEAIDRKLEWDSDQQRVIWRDPTARVTYHTDE